MCPLRPYPIYDSPHLFILDTDFSAVAVGGILPQVQNGAKCFIGCYSKSCDSTQSNYPSFKGELLAVILGLRKRFLIRTDSSAITFLTSMRKSRGMFAHWAVYLSSFDFDIKHLPGKQNTAVDALSRTVFPSQPRDPGDPDSFLVYPDIEDVYNIENNRAEWTLEYKKDLPLSQVMEFVKSGQTPSNEQRRGLCRSTTLFSAA